MKVKVIGAGSIGNHLTQACRRMRWDVTVVDTDPEALRRMKEEIYPQRYGAWDEGIHLVTSDQEPKGGFDIICIGTPPHVRLPLAIAALSEKPKILQLEKPLCAPRLERLGEFMTAYRNQSDTIAVVGYDHAVSESVSWITDNLREQRIGDAQSIDVEFREHWKGIFGAHPWLSGPQDTYLGFWQKGGGASGEHSHALHLWRHFAKAAGFGSWRKVSSFMDMKTHDGAEYDSLSAFTVETDAGRVGRIIQDVITLPTRKWIRLQGSKGFIEWYCNGHSDGDLVKYQFGDGPAEERIFAKKRPDDFYREILHIQDLINGEVSAVDSPISIESGVAVMELLRTAHEHRNEGAIIQML